MKLTNKILEAVNRGIKFALDDFEDDEKIQGQINSKVKYQGGTKEYLDLMNNVVDLGLPSGTLWCKYNLGCDWEKLNNNPQDTVPKNWYGYYYQWGELEPKENCSQKNYKFRNGRWGVTKYSDEDGLHQLLPEDDAATQKLGNNFHIPTEKQCQELQEYTNNKWIDGKIKLYQGIKGLAGMLLISKINSKQLFIPAAGIQECKKVIRSKVLCCIWSSYVDGWRMPSYIHYYNGLGYDYNWYERYNGLSIRPVVNL